MMRLRHTDHVFEANRRSVPKVKREVYASRPLIFCKYALDKECPVACYRTFVKV
ncbi:MAG: hypothetical protein V8R28_13555 [Bacteroides cellulosilyticus]